MPFPLGAYESFTAVYSLSKLFRTPPACLLSSLFLSIWDFSHIYVIVHSIGNSGHLIIIFLLFIVIILSDFDLINYRQVSINLLPSNHMLFICEFVCFCHSLLSSRQNHVNKNFSISNLMDLIYYYLFFSEVVL